MKAVPGSTPKDKKDKVFINIFKIIWNLLIPLQPENKVSANHILFD